MALPAKEFTTKQIKGVKFGFYTDDEVKKQKRPSCMASIKRTLPCKTDQVKRLSVKRILSPLIFDNLKNPIPDGLYDPAFGPVDARGW